MGRSVVRQPDGLFAVFNTSSDTFTAMDLDEGELVAELLADAYRRAVRETLTTVAAVKEHGKSGMNDWAACLRQEQRENYPEDHGRYVPRSRDADEED